MALSMEEQRILEEMGRRLADDDPRLASRLATFGESRLAHVMASRRVRVVVALLLVALLIAFIIAAYSLSPFRGHQQVQGAGYARTSAALSQYGHSVT